MLAQIFTIKRHSRATSKTPAIAPRQRLIVHILILTTYFITSVTCWPAQGTCSSPTGTVRVGEQVRLQWSFHGFGRPIIDTPTAEVRCLKGSNQIHTIRSVSNGYPWIVPSEVLGACTDNEVYITFAWPIHKVQCDVLRILEALGSSTATMGTTTSTTTTISATTITSTTATTASVIIETTTTTTTTLTSIAMVSSAPSEKTSTGSSISPLPTQPDRTVIRDLHGVNVPAVVSGAIAAVAVVALIVFALLIRRRRRRLACERRWLAEQCAARAESSLGIGTGTGTGGRGIDEDRGGSTGHPGIGNMAMVQPPHSGFVPRPEPSYRRGQTDYGNWTGGYGGNEDNSSTPGARAEMATASGFEQGRGGGGGGGGVIVDRELYDLHYGNSSVVSPLPNGRDYYASRWNT